MKLHYYPETDSLYIEFKPTPGTETREVVGGLNVDLDAAGEVVGFDIDHASKLVDLSTLETESLPLRNAGFILGAWHLKSGRAHVIARSMVLDRGGKLADKPPAWKRFRLGGDLQAPVTSPTTPKQSETL